MFEQLLNCPFHLRRHREGPLADERERFLKHMADEGFSQHRLVTINPFLLAVAFKVDADGRETYTEADLLQLASDWILRDPDRGTKPKHKRIRKFEFLYVARNWLEFLGRYRAVVSIQPFASEVNQFLDSLRRERGFAESTVQNREKTLSLFQTWLDPKVCRLGDIELRHIDCFQNEMAKRGWKRTTMSFHVQGLRAFFRYAFAQGWTKDLASQIGAPRIYQLETIPTGPSRDEVLKLIENERGPDPVRVRNRAMILLLAVYGFRSGEVCKLQLEDLDWESEQISVRRSKVRKTRSYPLTQETGDAILLYLRTVRPKSQCRTVFLTLRLPARPLSRSGFGSMVQKRLKTINPSLQHSGPHSIRHACASHLLREGMTLGEIGNHLGQVSVAATKIYAKVDVNALRQVATIPMNDIARHAEEAEWNQTPIIERGHMEALRIVANVQLDRLGTSSWPSQN